MTVVGDLDLALWAATRLADILQDDTHLIPEVLLAEGLLATALEALAAGLDHFQGVDLAVLCHLRAGNAPLGLEFQSGRLMR